jgi:hypothetical protein
LASTMPSSHLQFSTAVWTIRRLSMTQMYETQNVATLRL